MTLLCQVEQRFPVTVAALAGTLDPSTPADALAPLRAALVEQPVALVLDLAQLGTAGPAALRPLADLLQDTRRWPGSRIMVSGASPALRQLLTGLTGDGMVEYVASTGQALATAQRLPRPPVRSLPLAPTRHAPAASREVVALACRDWQLVRWQGLTQVITSELVTNAVVHAGTPITLTMRHVDGALQVAVRDRDPRLVHPTSVGHPAPLDGGRGRPLLDALADDWGCVPAGDGKVVWASVTVTPAPTTADQADG